MSTHTFCFFYIISDFFNIAHRDRVKIALNHLQRNIAFVWMFIYNNYEEHEEANNNKRNKPIISQYK